MATDPIKHPPTRARNSSKSEPTALQGLRGGTYNAAHHLEAHHQDVLALLCSKDLHFLCVSDPGPVTLSPVNLFPGYTLTLNQLGPNRYRQTAILLSNRIQTIGDPLRDPSGGFLAQDIQLPTTATKPQALRIIAVYQPPNNDTLFASASSAMDPPPANSKFCPAQPSRENKRAEANRMRGVLAQWTSDHPLAIVAGDFNEASARPHGRLSKQNDQSPPAWPPARHQTGPLAQLLNEDAFGIDLFSHLHCPSATRSPKMPHDCHKQGHTFWDPIHKRSSSRLDYILLKGDFNMSKAKCYTLHSVPALPLSSLHDHIPLLLELSIAIQAAPKQKPRRGIRTKHLTPRQQLQIHRSANTNAPVEQITEWKTALEALSSDSPTLEHDFNYIADEIANHFSEVGLKHCGKLTRIQSQPSSKTTKTRRQRKAYRAFNALTKLHNALREMLNTNQRLHWKAAASALKKLKKHHQQHLGIMKSAPLSNRHAWMHWLETVYPATHEAARIEVSEADKGNPHHPSQQKSRLMRDARSRGTLSKRILTDSHSTALHCARDDNGDLQTDPTIVNEIVATQAAKPFSKHRKSPAVPKWRPLTDEERTTGIPFWWEHMYAQNARALPPNLWNGLMEKVTVAELRAVIRKAKLGVSPGHDGIPLDLLRILVGATPLISSSDPGPLRAYADLVCALINASLRTEHCPTSLKRGVICLLPKPGKDSSIIGNRRPITLLPELGKITNRILATRYLSIIDSSPIDVFEKANRAYVQEGNHKQSLQALRDVCTHWCRTKDPKREEALTLLLYDLAKAFDSIQLFSIVAACKRYNLPRSFINYTVSTLTEADSCVRTAHGNTRLFRLHSSVRQGDPMAALLFNMVLDALHFGFKNNPLKGRNQHPQDNEGYEITSKDKQSINVSSIGFADDTNCPARSWNSAKLAHDWMLDFLTAHHLRLNASKTVVVVDAPYTPSFVAENTPPDPNGLTLPDIEEDLILEADNLPPPSRQEHIVTPLTNKAISTFPPPHPFHYLGLSTNMVMKSTPVAAKLEQQLHIFRSRLKSHHISPLNSALLISEILIPRLETNLTFSPLTKAQLSKMSSLVRSMTLRSDTGSSITGLSKPLFHLALGLPTMEDQKILSQAVHYGNTLRGSPKDPSTATSHHELHSAMKSHPKKITTKKPPKEMNLPPRGHRLLSSSAKKLPHHSGYFLPKALHDLNALGIQATLAAPPPPRTPFLGAKGHTALGKWYRAEPQPTLCFGPNRYARVRTGPYDPNLAHSYATPESPPDPTLAVFTDGSFRAKNGASPPIKRGGYAAVITLASNLNDPTFTFQPERIVTISGGSPGAGQSYSAEHLAILAVLQAVPINTPLIFYSDCLSAIQALDPSNSSSLAPHYKPTSQRLRQGTRPIVSCSRRRLPSRVLWQAPTTFHHVKAHTGKTDILSLGNALADKIANEAAEDPASLPAQQTPFTVNEERIIFWVKHKPNASPTHVIGNLRPVIKKQQQKAHLVALKKLRKQGEVARQVGHRLPRRLEQLRKAHKSTMFFFLLRASAQLLPTPESHVARNASNQRTQVLHCPLCKRYRAATSRHSFECTAVIPLLTSLHHPIPAILTSLALPTLASPHVTAATKARIRTLTATMAWYKPYAPLHNADPSQWSEEGMANIDAMNKYDRYCGMLGFLPPKIEQLLIPKELWESTPEQSINSLRQHIDEHKQRLQDLLLESAATAFHHWKSLLASRISS